MSKKNITGCQFASNAPSLVKTIVGMSVLILLYLLAANVVLYVSRSTEVLVIGGKSIPYSAFAGVLASVANICVIIMVVFYRKAGFIAALLMLAYQFPSIFIRIFSNLNPSALSGLFTNLLTLTAVIMIRLNAKRAEKTYDTIREQALIDRMTGLPNQYAFTKELDRLTKSSKSFCVVSIDLNSFKGINETMGYETGNKVLQEIAARWKNIAETRTSAKHDMILRVAGDEFMLMIHDYNSDEQLLSIIRQYESALNELITIDDCDFYITASYGYAEYPTDAYCGDALVACADAAVNEVKRLSSSGEHILRFAQGMIKTKRTLEIEQNIRDALDKDLISITLQPQYNMSHVLRGFEVLATMKDLEGNKISPAEFIPVAEKVGLIDKVDHCILKKAAEFFGPIFQHTRTDISFSVNVSVRHIMKNGFIDEIKQIISDYNIPPNQLEIEVNESIMIDSIETALERVNELKQMGVMIAIDNFGTGYSSLNYLSKFPADLIKVDKTFTEQMNTNESSKQYIASIISIGHVMKFDVIAGGVEQPEEIETLKSIGCDFIQGFVWGGLMPPEEAKSLITGGSYY